MSEVQEARHILVVANETAVSKALVDLIEDKAKEASVRVTVLAPVNQPRQGRRSVTQSTSSSRTR